MELINVRSKKVHYLTRYVIRLYPFVYPLFYFGMFQNIVIFLKLKIINLLIFLLCISTLNSKLFKKNNKYLKNQFNWAPF